VPVCTTQAVDILQKAVDASGLNLNAEVEEEPKPKKEVYQPVIVEITPPTSPFKELPNLKGVKFYNAGQKPFEAEPEVI